MTAVAINVTINVITQATATTAPLYRLLESELEDFEFESALPKVHISFSRLRPNLALIQNYMYVLIQISII